MEKTVNIGMITYNRIEFTKQAFDSLMNTDAGFPFILTVVDNNSTDGTQNYLKSKYHEGKIKNLILLNENLGVAKASNLAWQMEDTEYYMKYDNDMVVCKDKWLAPMIEILEVTESIGMLGYSVEQYNREITYENGFPIRVKIGNLGGACVLIPKRTKEKLGYWVEDYGLYAEEDADYGRRIEMIGLINAYMSELGAFTHLCHMERDDYDRYFKWKDAQRASAIPKLVDNLTKFNNKERPIFVEAGTKIEDFKQFIYKG